MLRLAWIVLCVCVCSWTRVAAAQTLLEASPVEAGQVRVDGSLGEWRGQRFAQLGDEAGAQLSYRLGVDATGLYVAARVHDDAFVRSARPGPREDAIVIRLAIPGDEGRYRAQELWLFAGIEGKQSAVAALGAVGASNADPTALGGAQIVEGPLDKGQGYALEAFVPWAKLGGARNWPLARAAIRLQDVDKAGDKPGGPAPSAPFGDAAALPPLAVDGSGFTAQRKFLIDKGLGMARPRFDAVADVAAGPALEHVVVVGTLLIVFGPEIEAGSAFQYADLPVNAAPDVLGAELRDLTGSGKRQLTLRVRQKNELGSRELFQVYDLNAQPLRASFAIELEKRTDAGSVRAELEVAPGRGKQPPELRVRAGKAEGLSAANYQEQPARGSEPILLPWGKLRARSYRWDGHAFAVVSEQQNPDYVAPAVAGAVTASAARAADVPRVATRAEPPGTDALVAAFVAERGLPRSARPRFVQHVNLAEDSRLESLMLFGSELLVVGKGFQEGTGYFYFGLPVKSPEDVLRMFTADVTGDGRREVFVRVRQLIGDVTRELLLAYSFDTEALRPILQVEVRRAQAANSVGNVVRVVKSGKYWALQIDPGRAEGWAANSYPFVAESQDSFGPLLLPWLHERVTYRYGDGALKP
jgi:hypothetical protein